MMIYVKFLDIFYHLTQWTSLDLSLSWEEQIWYLHNNLIGLSTVPVIFWHFMLRLHGPTHR